MHNYKQFGLLLVLLLLFFQGQSQSIIALETKWHDSFKEWTIHTEGDSIEGSLEILWKLDDDWTEWTFEIGDLVGQAKQRFNDPGFWEFRSGQEIITAQTVWSRDFTQWRLTDGEYIIKLRSKYRDMPVLWYSEGEQYGYIDIFREYEDDPSLWLIDDSLEEEISPLYRMAMIFLVIYHSTPKF